MSGQFPDAVVRRAAAAIANERRRRFGPGQPRPDVLSVIPSSTVETLTAYAEAALEAAFPNGRADA